MKLDDTFKNVYDSSNELKDIVDSRFVTFCELIESRFPNLSCIDANTGDYLITKIEDRPLEKGLGWTQVSTKGYRLGNVIISNKADLLDNLHFDSVIAHEAAHVAAYNWIFQSGKDVSEGIQEWKDCGGHTKVWHEIVDKLNNLKLKTGEKAFDIVEKIDEKMLDKYFSDEELC